MRKAPSLLFSALLSISLATGFPSTVAIAHSGVVSSNPSAGQVLTELPKNISVTFSEELLVIAGKAVNALTLTAQDKTQVPLTDVRVDGNLLLASVPVGDFPAGLYEIGYRVISADGHEVSDAITFSLDAPAALPASSTPPEVAESQSEPFALPLPIVLAIALLIVAGGFLALERRRRAH